MRYVRADVLFIASVACLRLLPGAFSMQGSHEYLSGYAGTLSGASMPYASPISAARNALISRATDGASSIIWRTEVVPKMHGQNPATFIWLAGLGCNKGERRFTLSINGRDSTTFTTANKDSWETRSPGGAQLRFQTVMIDRATDRFGFMSLVLPPGMVEAGKPIELRVTGEAARSLAWVMTFTYVLEDGLTAVPRPVLLREKGKVVQPLDFETVNAGKPKTVNIHIPGSPDETIAVPFGVTRQCIKLAPVTAAKTLHVELTIAGFQKTILATLTPVRPWTIYLVQHAHTDIGYTRPQTEILAEHLRYIDYALDYCDLTDSYPDDAKFRWTCETSWAVREYLKTRPEKQIARLKKRVMEGRIEVTGMFLNWSEVADENALVRSLEPIGTMRELGLPVKTAMQDDVNGFAWCLVDYLHDLGIKYISSGINVTRALKPFKVPTPFWWESPSGKRVLAYRADHYMTGNFYNVQSENFESIERELPGYLQQLAADGYSYDRISMQYSGYFTDNSPPSTFACDNIRRWNETYESPKLRSATISEFLQWVEQEHGKTLPSYRVAWPDWWTDGFGCSMRETAADRRSQTELIVNQGLLAMAQAFGASLPGSVFQQMESLADNLHFYNEHTFGAAESISDPMGENSQTQWAEKSSYVWQGVMQSRLLREAALGQLQPFLHPSSEPSIVLFNTLNWGRSGLHVLYIDNQILPREKAFRIVDDRNHDVPIQLVQSRAEGNYWALWVSDVPPLGYRTCRIVADSSPPLPNAPFEPGDTVQNDFYRLILDRESGAIQHLYDRELGRELLDPQSSWRMGQFIYERLADRHHLEELSLGEYTRTALRNVMVKAGIDGPIWQSFILTGIGDGFGEEKGLSCEIRLFKVAKRIDLLFNGSKKTVNDPEAVYVAFPLALQDGQLFFEAQGGIVRPGENQLPGTATDWNAVQNFAALRSAAAQVILVSDEVPLMQFGGINTGRYQAGAKPATNHIYSWVLNNYWTTNFRSSQEGEMSWSYVLTSGADVENTFAARFGWGIRVPFVSRVLPKAIGGSPDGLSRSAWPFAPSSLLLVSARPAPRGTILHLREMAGKSANLELTQQEKGWKLEEVDALGSRLRRAASLSFKPFETKFLRLWR